MKTAQELWEDFVREIGLPVGQSFVLIEDEPRGGAGRNWVPSIGNTPDQVTKRYESALKNAEKLYPKVDWSGVETRNGQGRRHIAAIKTA
jgi:hypothetical protein